MFEKVKSIGHIEPFLATKSMKIGDTLLLHVGTQNLFMQWCICSCNNNFRAIYLKKSTR